MGLCKLALAKEYLKITSATYDAIITNLIARASIQIDTLTNRTLKKTSYKELYSGDGDNELLLDHAPIVSVSKLSDDIDNETKTINEEIAATKYLIKAPAGIIALYDASFSPGPFNIYIEYEAGYTDDNNEPTDLAHVCAEMVAKKFKDIEEGRIGLASKNIMSQNIVFNYADLTKLQREIIDRYRMPPIKFGISVDSYT